MLSRIVIFAVLVGSIAANSTCLSAQRLTSQVAWIPREAVALLEITNPRPLLELALTPPLLSRLTESPYFERMSSGSGYRQLSSLVWFLEKEFGLEWQEILGRLVDGGFTLAMGPKKRSVLIVESEHEALLAQLHGVLLNAAREGARRRGKPDPLSPMEYRDVDGWVSPSGKVHAILENRLLLASDRAVFKRVVDLHFSGGRGSFAKCGLVGDGT